MSASSAAVVGTDHESSPERADVVDHLRAVRRIAREHEVEATEVRVGRVNAKWLPSGAKVIAAP